MTFLFWLSIILIVYTIVGYPLVLFAMWAIRGRRSVPTQSSPMRVDFLIPAHNEGSVIAEKLRNTLALSNSAGHDVRVLVISDGSTDDTVLQAQSIDEPRIRVVETPGRDGKLKALNQALDMLDGDVVVFSDANAMLSEQALDVIMTHFSDPQVGGVCGQITVDTTKGGAMAKADAQFWRYDQWMKQAESDLGGVVSAQGSIYAIRRALTKPVPQGFADDFLMSVRVVEQGFRLAFAPEATTVEEVTERARDEMGRRIRSTEMGWRGLMEMRHLMNPFRYGLYAWQLASHKGLRRLTPLFLLIAFISNLVLMGAGTGWFVLGLAQIAFYSVALAAYLIPALRAIPLVPKIMFFCLGICAMAFGIIRYYLGHKSSLWTPIRNNS